MFFIEFLERLLVKTYPTQAVILVMDNASYHYSAKVQAALSLFEHRVQLFWLPQYCPELNVIERFWCASEAYSLGKQIFTYRLMLYVRVVLRVLQQQNDPSCSDRLIFSKFFQ